MKKNTLKGTYKKSSYPTDQVNKNQKENQKYFEHICLAIVIVLGIIIYSNSFACPFHFDDKTNIVDNLNIRSLSDIKSLWNFAPNRFVPDYTFALNYHFNQLNAWGYHLINLAIHLINSLLVWWFTILIFSTPVIKNNPISRFKKSIAFIIALLFVSHPLATESVTYIVQRDNSIEALFYFLSLGFYMKGRISKISKRYKFFLFAGSIILAILAMLSKENASTLPVVIVLIELFFIQTKSISDLIKKNRIFILSGAILCIIFIVLCKIIFHVFDTLKPDEFNDYKTITALNYLYTQFSVIPKYIQLLILPIHQNFDYDFPISSAFFELKTILGLIVILSLITLGIFLYNKIRIISFGIFWFFITIAVESSVVPISDLIFEHRTYLPSFGFYLILSSLIYQFLWNKTRNVSISIMLLIIVSNSYMTYARNEVWKDEISLWSDAILKSPNKARPYINRATQYVLENKIPEAIRDYKAATDINSNWTIAYSNLGKYLAIQNDTKNALIYLNKAIETDSNYYQAYNNRGNLFINENKLDEAYNDFSKTIKLKPDFAEAYNNRGNVLLNENRFEDAINDYCKAINLSPNFADAYNNRATSLVQLKKFKDALNDINKSLELNYNNPNALLNRASIFNVQKKYKEALIDINKAIELKHDFADGYYNRGIVEYNMEDKNSACKDWEYAAKLGYQPAVYTYKKYCQ
jgi:tetratricopeptide (TPR) repeat protein